MWAVELQNVGGSWAERPEGRLTAPPMTTGHLAPRSPPSSQILPSQDSPSPSQHPTVLLSGRQVQETPKHQCSPGAAEAVLPSCYRAARPRGGELCFWRRARIVPIVMTTMTIPQSSQNQRSNSNGCALPIPTRRFATQATKSPIAIAIKNETTGRRSPRPRDHWTYARHHACMSTF
jgi:hypothetical protein